MKITYTYEPEGGSHLATDTWIPVYHRYCPFCGTWQSLFQQVDSDTRRYDEDNAGDILVCIVCKASFHLPELEDGGTYMPSYALDPLIKEMWNEDKK
jgi:hypothetical protein